MSAPDLSHVRDVVASTRRAQGLPPKVTDPLVVGKVADVLRTGERKAA